jgi:hypothetical protein
LTATHHRLPVSVQTRTGEPAGNKTHLEVPAMYQTAIAAAPRSHRVSLSAVVCAWMLNAAMFVNIFVLHA